MLVVFATNMDPSELVDAAFLRRMQTKIRVDAATEDQFCAIFRRVAHDRGLRVDDAVVRELAQAIRSIGQELRGCQPRDLVNQVCWAARYEDRPPVLDRASLGRAVEAYFLVEKRPEQRQQRPIRALNPASPANPPAAQTAPRSEGSSALPGEFQERSEPTLSGQ